MNGIQFTDTTLQFISIAYLQPVRSQPNQLGGELPSGLKLIARVLEGSFMLKQALPRDPWRPLRQIVADGPWLVGFWKNLQDFINCGDVSMPSIQGVNIPMTDLFGGMWTARCTGERLVYIFHHIPPTSPGLHLQPLDRPVWSSELALTHHDRPRLNLRQWEASPPSSAINAATRQSCGSHGDGPAHVSP